MGREGRRTVETYEGDNGEDMPEGRWSEASEQHLSTSAWNYLQAQNASELDYEDQSLATTLPLEKPCTVAFETLLSRIAGYMRARNLSERRSFSSFSGLWWWFRTKGTSILCSTFHSSQSSLSSSSHGADQVTRNIPQAPISNSQYPISSLPGVPLQPSARIPRPLNILFFMPPGYFPYRKGTSNSVNSLPNFFNLIRVHQDLTSTFPSPSVLPGTLRIVAIGVWSGGLAVFALRLPRPHLNVAERFGAAQRHRRLGRRFGVICPQAIAKWLKRLNPLLQYLLHTV
ncbi:hypothetical protein B0H11DRAFT_1935156 [Mycena galericulata]|nr:hypothetical protein B0H11DRAFT_1935156 [Mycena galericulata]